MPDLDLETLNLMLNDLARYSLMEGVQNAQSGRPIDNNELNSRVKEALVFVIGEVNDLTQRANELTQQIEKATETISTLGRIIADDDADFLALGEFIAEKDDEVYEIAATLDTI